MLKISDLCIENKPISLDVADKILEFHIRPMENVQKKHNGEITCSRRSGYRSPEYEILKGRSGTGQHTFTGRGAVDWITSGDLNELLDEMIQETGYTRICIYKESLFIHADYKKEDGHKHIYCYDKKIKDWTKIEKIPLK